MKKPSILKKIEETAKHNKRLHQESGCIKAFVGGWVCSAHCPINKRRIK